MSTEHDAPGGLHARLRRATAAAHAALESGMDWHASVATRDGYRVLLARYHGFHAAFEPAIGAGLGDAVFVAPRLRTAALEADLSALGLSAVAIAALPRHPAPSLHRPAAAMGALYVLEGSTLGGRVIARHVTRVLGPNAPLSYYDGRAGEAGAMWAAFRSRLAAFSDGPEADTLIGTAIETFDAIGAWLKT